MDHKLLGLVETMKYDPIKTKVPTSTDSDIVWIFFASVGSGSYLGIGIMRTSSLASY
jgi:hypothetical protein